MIAVVLSRQILLLNAPVVQQAQSHRVYNQWPKFFHQVERQGRFPVAGGMEVTNIGVKTNASHGTGYLRRQNGIAITQQGIDRVRWWAAYTFLEAMRPVTLNELSEHVEVGRASGSFTAQQWTQAVHPPRRSTSFQRG